jgi:hypothetical protein
MKSIKLHPIMSDEEANKLTGSFLDKSMVKHFITEDTEVFKENGDLLAVLKKKCDTRKNIRKCKNTIQKSSTKNQIIEEVQQVIWKNYIKLVIL